METGAQLRSLDCLAALPPFAKKLRALNMFPLCATGLEILQINTGRQCNLSCRHCHVDAGPHRTEIMSRPVLDKCLDVLSSCPVSTIDITGGAPEMNPHLAWFIGQAARLGRRLIVRSNLTLLLEEDYRHFLDVFTANRVEIVTSLPHYWETKTDRQLGAGVFNKVIAVLRKLNCRCYGRENTGLQVDIVHNPSGAYLPDESSPRALLRLSARLRQH